MSPREVFMSMQKQWSMTGVHTVLVALAMSATACGDDGANQAADSGTQGGGGKGCTQSALGAEDAGTDLDTGLANEPATDGASAAPTFQQVYDEVIAANSCDSAFCHGGTGSGGLVLLEGVAYESLVGVASAGEECSCVTTKKLVEPGRPEASLLVEKLEDTTPSCGAQMPPPGTQDPVTAAQLELLRAWIAGGARP
jgi:hypothetical protein